VICRRVLDGADRGSRVDPLSIPAFTAAICSRERRGQSWTLLWRAASTRPRMSTASADQHERCMVRPLT